LRRAIVDGMADTFYAIGADWRVTDFNAHAAPHLLKLGKDPAHFIGQNVWEEFPDSPVEEVCRQVMRDRVPITHEHYNARLDEWVEDRIYPSPDGGIAVFQRYITERKRVDEKRRRSETYLAQAQALTHTGSWALNPRTGELFWSAEHFRIFGLDPVHGPPTVEAVVSCIHPEDRPLADETLACALAERRSYTMDLRIVRPDGEVRHVRSTGQPVFDASGDLVDYVGTIMDMTELQRAEEALHQAQTALAHVTRVTTMGELVASLAHELNQPLAAIATNGGASLRFLGRPSPDVDKAMAAISCMIQDAERAGEVMAGTRAFLKKSRGERILLDINRKIRDVLVVIRPEIRKQRVVLHELLANDLPLVHGVCVQFQQVVLNLTMNAIEAMAPVTDRRRELTVRSARHDVDGTPGVLVSVQDSGIGLAEADLGRLFDAFYTTKPDGLGMGLSISRSAIEAHGGHLWATSNATVGATFQFIVPVQSEPTP